MTHPRIALVALTTCFLTTVSNAQQSVDIGLFEDENGALEIRVTPATDLDGILSNLCFTLSWDNSTSATFEAPQQDPATGTVATVAPSGGVHTAGSTNYRIYTVIGLTSFAEAGLHWEAGRSYTLATIRVHGRVQVELATDAWAHDPHNNGEYYVSVGGLNATGGIAQASAWVGRADVQASVFPNPCDGEHLTIIVLNAPQEVNAVLLDILNAQGELVARERLPLSDGQLNTTMELDRALAKGNYTVSMVVGDHSFTERLLVAR